MTQQAEQTDEVTGPLDKREWLLKYWDVAMSGDMETFRTMVHENAVAHYPGNHFLSGDYHGREAIIGLYTKLYQIGPKNGTFVGECHDAVVSDDHAAALVKYDIVLGPGRKISGQAVGVFHLDNGKMVEYWLLERDQKMINDVFRLAGKATLRSPGSKLALVPHALMNPLAVVRLFRRVARQKKGTNTKML